VLNTPDASTQSVTELTLGLILGLLRFISESDREVRSGLWRKRTGFLLEELTFGIVGLGRIGRNLAEILKRMGARVIGHDAQCDKNWSDPLGISCMPMVDVLKNADVVSLHLPLVPGLLHCIGAHELSLMKKGSFIVNTARGGLVDEKALFDSLAQGYLGGAALDVFEREPYEGPLRNLPNVILTPHIGSYARRSRARMELEAAQNLVNALTEMDLLGSRASQFLWEGSMKKLTIIAPVYNEAPVIEKYYNEVKSVLDSLNGYSWDILFVLDRSSDGSLEILSRIATADPAVCVLSLSSRFGHQNSLVAGLDHAQADVVIMMDSDLQHPPSLIPEMVRAFEKGQRHCLHGEGGWTECLDF
jgi:hypothetical protein